MIKITAPQGEFLLTIDTIYDHYLFLEDVGSIMGRNKIYSRGQMYV